MASIAIELNFPPEIKVLSYEFHQGAHAFEVDWPLPECHRCERCSHEQRLLLEYKDHALVIRDLDLWGEPSFWVYQVVFHRCEKCAHRQHLLPPFKRKDVTYTYRFEQHVLRMMIGSNEEEVARRLGVSAETVRRIVLNQLADAKDKQIDPSRKISDVGLDEISLKKRHKLYVTLMTDLSDPQNPEILAMAKGKDEAAGNACLLKLSEEQRRAVRTYRVDMGAAYNKAGKTLLLKAKAVIDRFHVAKKFGEAVDAERKKITQAYRATLTTKERKEFKALMWEFRRAPEDLSAEQKAKLEALFAKLPQLRKLLVRQVAATAETARGEGVFQADLRQRCQPHGGLSQITRLAYAGVGRWLGLGEVLCDLPGLAERDSELFRREANERSGGGN
jgi:transposase